MQIITNNPKETKKTAKILAREIIKTNFNLKQAFVVGLYGDLGSGKTTFVQGFAKGLKIKEKITSPTFVLIHRHKIKPFFRGKKINFENFYHCDFYRLNNASDLKVLNFNKILNNPKNLVLIEWPNKIEIALPKNILKIKINPVFKNGIKRKLLFNWLIV